jgi:diguanylate cyclase
MINVDTQVLWLAAAAAAAVAASLVSFGVARQRYGGWRIWLGSLGGVTAGLALAAAAGYSVVLLIIAELLLLQWPIACLIGVRRFHARLPLPGSESTDRSVAGLAALVLLGGAAWAADSGPFALAPAAASLAVHLYAASVLFCGPAGHDGARLRLLGGTLALSAIGPVLWALPAWEAVPTLALRGVATVLAAVVTAFIVVGLICDRTERQLRDSRRRLRVLANIDSLTNVPNRRHFHELASRTLAADPPGSAALVIFDVDHFKQVNDNLGHAAGDRALRLVARCVQDVLRANDVPGRHGGDEFVLLLRRATTSEAMAVANRIVGQVQRQAQGHDLPSISLSFGIVHLYRGEGLDDALRRADQALYEAKRQGRSRAVAATGRDGRPVFTESERLGLTAA